jgi:hypothetical protein
MNSMNKQSQRDGIKPHNKKPESTQWLMMMMMMKMNKDRAQ